MRERSANNPIRALKTHKHPPISLLASDDNVLWGAEMKRRRDWNPPIQSIAVIKFRAGSEISPLCFIAQKTLAPILGRETLIRPLLITVIGHRASRECRWPIAVNLLSVPLLLLLHPRTIKILLGIFCKRLPVKCCFVLRTSPWLTRAVYSCKVGNFLKSALKWKKNPFQMSTFCLAASAGRFLHGFHSANSRTECWRGEVLLNSRARSLLME